MATSVTTSARKNAQATAYVSIVASGTIEQRVEGKEGGATTDAASLTNNGSISIRARATATNTDGQAIANASLVDGIFQNIAGPYTSVSAAFVNSGTLTIGASASAISELEEAVFVRAQGNGSGSVTASTTLTNNGTMTAASVATASSTALGGDGFSTAEDAKGTIILVQAQASGSDEGTANSTITNAGTITATFANSGTIRTTAITNGGASRATGILVTDFALSPVVPGSTDRMTIVNNGGTIIARESITGGATFRRGTAINTSAAPNPVDIRFLGNSNVYGNIILGALDTITVASGTTTLDGVVGPAAAVGSISVSTGGTLFRVNQPTGNASYDGLARVNVNTFTLASGSILRLQMPSALAATAAQASYPRITAGTANLTGANLVLQLNTPNGLYDNVYVFNDVIDAALRNGQFASVTTNTRSVLLAPTAAYDANANVDITLTQVRFNAVAVLTANQQATGGAIEAVYSPTQTGAYGTLLTNLFLINNAGDYAEAMNQLSGAQYAGHMQALRNNALQVSTLVSDQVDCAAISGGIKECRERADGLRLWALGAIHDGRVRTDGNGIGHSSDGSHALLGVDYTVSNFTAGAFGGYRKVDSEFDLYGGEINSDGFQIGLLAGYDVGDFYLRANGSHAKLNGDAVRNVGVLTTAGTIAGEPDFRVTSFYTEAGGRFALGESWVTPFVGVEYITVKMNGFTETGVGGANLDFGSQSQGDTSFLAGVKWSGKLGIVVPEAKVAYRSDDKGVFGTAHSFADAPGAALFDTASSQSDKDTVMAGVSLAALFDDKVTGRIGPARQCLFRQSGHHLRRAFMRSRWGNP